ncbi:MAG: alpha/beta hydrolase [Sphingobacteriia bacterium]|nr:alpha/beta hydrolase [Sphingobacteriia bacterium]
MTRILITILSALISIVPEAQCLPDYGYPTKQLQLDSARINYVDQGKGTPIVMIHGLGGNATHWKRNIGILSEQYRCIAIDLPGYGGSTVVNRTEASAQLDFYAERIAAMLGQLKINKAIVMGHSMGGQIAMILALKYPLLISKLILVAPAGLESFTTAEAAVLTTYATAAFYEKQDSAAIEKSYRMNFHQMTEEAAKLVRERIALKQCEGFAAYCAQIPPGIQGMLGHPVKEQLSGIVQPTLILFGTSDALIPNKILHPGLTVAAVAAIAKQIPVSKTILINEAGHLVQFEKPAIVNQTILQFLHQ